MRLETVIRDYWDEKDVTRTAEVTIPDSLVDINTRLIWDIRTEDQIDYDLDYHFVVAANDASSAFALILPHVKRNEYNKVVWDIKAIGTDHDPVGPRIIAKVR